MPYIIHIILLNFVSRIKNRDKIPVITINSNKTYTLESVDTKVDISRVKNNNKTYRQYVVEHCDMVKQIKTYEISRNHENSVWHNSKVSKHYIEIYIHKMYVPASS